MRRLAITLVAIGTLGAVLAGPAAAAQRRAHVDVIEVNGLIDPIEADFVTDALRDAERGDAEAMVIQLDSTGGAISGRDLDLLTFKLAHAKVPVGVWVGGSGRPRAEGPAFELMQAASVSGVAPGGRVGPAGRTMSVTDAVRRRVADVAAPTLGDFIVALDGRKVGGVTLETAKVVRSSGQDPRREPIVTVRFAKLGLGARLLHTVASPSAACTLLVAGLLLLVFEFFTAGIGIAAAVGLVCLGLAAYGLGVLPTRPSSLLLIVLGVLGFSIDVQSGAPRAWTVIGTVALAVGCVRLYDGLGVSLVVLCAVVAGTALAMVAGMPAMVRTRFSTPTIGRESMVGEEGAALADIAPEGTVEVRGAPWRARTNRATPISAGSPVRVVGIDGLLLEVEPTEGAAKDYRH